MIEKCATCKHWKQNLNPNKDMGDCEQRKLDPETDEIFETSYDFSCRFFEKAFDWGSFGGVDNNAEI